MSTITLDKVHDLLEKLAEYVMTELPTRKEVDEKLVRLEIKLENKLAQKADKTDADRIENKVDSIINGMDSQARQLDTIQNELKAVSRTLDIHEKRLGDLEQRTMDDRVRDEEE